MAPATPPAWRRQHRRLPIYTDAQPAPHNPLYASQHAILVHHIHLQHSLGVIDPAPGHATKQRPIPAPEKRAIIAGSAGGFVFVLMSVLGAVFWYRKRQYEFLDALAAPTQRVHLRTMLFAGEDLDEDDGMPRPLSGGGGGGESIRMRRLHSPHPSRTVSHPSAPSTSTPSPRSPGADTMYPHSSVEALHHPSRATPATPSPVRAYMSQYLARARSGNVFREQLDFDHDKRVYRDEERGEGEGKDIHMCTSGITAPRPRSRSWRARRRRRTQARRRSLCGPALLEQVEGGAGAGRRTGSSGPWRGGLNAFGYTYGCGL
ncbi:hypothetical protein FIBSPDRAFT_1046278 [Athelia psychrophila]|uniref:Uncharacterized protein n=1 Tax=Athelia psychrophila TaxID=1759441 RepID=A0A166GVN6_9AGAM|nr:hypothetical protein FIBSPDRAFT_1046278 [Fibularhizoctonia sp. CBS 109695]